MSARKNFHFVTPFFFESRLIFNSQSRNVCQLSYLHQISATENEEWKILESRTEKDEIFKKKTLEKEREVTGQLARQKEKARVEDRERGSC